MVSVSHLTKNRKIASIVVRSFVATVALDCSSSMDRGEGSACRDLETAFAQHFHELGLGILLHPLFYGIQHFTGGLKRPTTPLVGEKSFHVSCTSVWLPTLPVLVP